MNTPTSKAPLVSVVISTYNRADKIKETVRTVLDQTFQNFEIIIVDDASTDNTPAVLKKLSEEDTRISYYVLQENSGGAATPKNKAIEKSKGTYIATLDSDDLWYPNKLEMQIELLEKNPDVLIAGCAFKNIRDGGSENQLIPNTNHRKKILIKDYMGPGSCMLYRRELFDKTGPFDPHFKNYQDWDMRIRASLFSDFLFVNEPLLDYIVDEQSISNRSRVKTDYYLREITKKHLSVLLKNPLELCIHFFYLIVRHILTTLRLNHAWLYMRNKILKNRTF